MQKRVFLITLLIVSASFLNSLYAQMADDYSPYPAVGRHIPPFVLDDVEGYYKTKVTPQDFVGHWLVIDCWNRYCGGCISSMPHTDSLSKKYGSRVNFLLVGYNGSMYTHRSDDSAIRVTYKALQAEKGISLPIAYDSTFFDLFDISGCPFIIVADPQGIIRAFTYKLKEDDLVKILNGETPVLGQVVTKGLFREEWHMQQLNRIEKAAAVVSGRTH